MKIRRAVIQSIAGSFGSGILSLHLLDSNTGELSIVHADNGPTVRALAASFPGVIGPGHTLHAPAVIDKEIFWWYDDLGLCLGGIAPVNDETEAAFESMIQSGEVS